MKFTIGVVAVVQNGDHFLCMRRSATQTIFPSTWETLSGGVKAGEHPIDTAARRISETTGLHPQRNVQIDPRPVTSYQSAHLDDELVVIVYRAQYLDGEVRLSAVHDLHAWMTQEAFAKRTAFSELAEAVALSLKI